MRCIRVGERRREIGERAGQCASVDVFIIAVAVKEWRLMRRAMCPFVDKQFHLNGVQMCLFEKCISLIVWFFLGLILLIQ